MKRQVKILPSLLAGDFGRLEESAVRAEQAGADALHLDIMDAHFVPNLSMGPDVVRMARRAVRIPLSVHLMMERPDAYAQEFIEAGATDLLIHIEARCAVAPVLRRIRELGATPGIVLNPETPLEAIIPVLADVEQVLFMTVHPGFGGQQFMAEVLPKIAELARRLRAGGKRARGPMDILVDGGVDLETAATVAGAGANALIAGNSLYRAKDMAADLGLMRQKAAKALEAAWPE